MKTELLLSNCGALESPSDCKEIKSVTPKENLSRIFIERTDDEVEAPILWPPEGKSQIFGKGPDAGKDRRQKEKEITEDQMVVWHQFEQILGDGERQ